MSSNRRSLKIINGVRGVRGWSGGGVEVATTLHRMQRRRLALNFTHVSVMDNRHVPVVPGDRDRVPSRFGDNAAIGGITPPKTAGVDLQVLGFGD